MKKILLVGCVLVPIAAWSPFILDPSRFGGGILSLSCLALFLACIGKGKKLSLAPGAAMIAIGLVAGFLPWLGKNPEILVGGLADRAPIFTALGLVCLASRLGKDLKKSFFWIIGGGVCAALYGITQTLGFDPLSWSPSPDAAGTAPLAGRNHAAEFFAVLLVAAFAFIRPWTGENPKIISWALAPLSFQLGYLDILAARISVPLGLALVCGTKRHRWIPATILLTLFAGGEITRKTFPPPWAVKSSGEAGRAAFSTVTDRWNESIANLTQVSLNPLGVGLGTFEREHPTWRPALSGPRADDPSARRAKTPHSEPFLALIECGWLGALLLALGLFKLLKHPLRASWTNPALVTLGIHALVRSPLSDNPAVLALGALLIAWPAKASPSQRQTKKQLFLIGLLVILGAVFAPSQVMGEKAVAQRMKALQDTGALEQKENPGFIPGGRKTLKEALDWRPWDVRARNLMTAELAAAGENPERIRRELMQSLRLDPSNLFALTGLFRIELEAGNEPLALELLDLAERIDAGHSAVRNNRTVWLEQQAKRQKDGAISDLIEGDATARGRLLAGHLVTALAQVRKTVDYPKESQQHLASCRDALRSAVFYADTHRALVERVLGHPEIDETMVRALLIKILPSWEPFVGYPKKN